ncbi:hypothetical protein [Anaeromyxobacter diazotrophicus]|uniref:Uncharacterized protein n=1 Tax=Anaeromyxobacter diazotrophicus TaxID=2590199 RepID=A0A7I9VRT5_9BACT|nr:hypothetical protein [Anaeromyxobacter diazotrophicus]GEJ59125.1 hypothetical protein AMYX_38660 [Anaeromyxobacter diazotrophicus]
MPVLHVLFLAAALAAPPDLDPAGAARVAMREALREAAPLPSGRPALPEGALPAGQLTDASRASNREVERMAMEHAEKSAGAMRQGGMGSMRGGGAGDSMRGDRQAGEPSSPAEMMRSRGMMPGRGPTTPNPPHRGM